MSSPTATTSDIRPLKKRRAAIACTACHGRKVRCNVVFVGQPCSNCQQDHTVCALHVSARGKHKHRKVSKGKEDVPLTTEAITGPPEPSSVSSISANSGRTAATLVPSSTSSGAATYNKSRDTDFSVQDEYEHTANVDAYRNIVDCADKNELRVPLYVGTYVEIRA